MTVDDEKQQSSNIHIYQ